MASPAEMDVNERQDLAGVVSRYRRYVPLVVLITVLGMVIAGGLTMLISKKYTASAAVMFAPQSAPLATGTNPVLSDQARDAAIDAQIQMVQSLGVANMVLHDLKLENDPGLEKAAQRFVGRPEERMNAMASALLTGLRARRVGQTSLFEVNYTDRNPLRAAEVANGFVDAYLRAQVTQKVTQTRGDARRLDSRLETLRGQVERAEAAVAQYKASNGLISASGSTLAEQEISSLNSELANTRAQQAESEARYRAAQTQISRGSQGADVGDALASPVVAQLRQQKAAAEQRVAELSGRYGPRHPDVVTARNALDSVNSQIQQEINRILSNLNAQTSVSQQRTASLQGSLAEARGRLSSNNSATVRLNDLQRDADAAKTLYESFLASSKENSAAQALIQPDARISAPATPPLSPSSPNLPVNLLLGAVIGLAAGLGIAFVRDRWSVGLDTIDDIDRHLGQPYLNSLPTLASSIEGASTTDPMQAVIAHPLSRYAEAFRSLGASLLYSSGPNKVKVVGITSALPKEGKTTTAVCLARVLAMGGQKVALLDSDLRRRSVTEALAPTAEIGLIEVLDGKVPLGEAMLLDEASGMRFLPLGKGAHLAKSPFASDAFGALIKQLRDEFDVVILDTAPILAVVDTRMLLHHLDVLAMLARWRATPIKAIRAAIHQVEGVGGKVLGVAMTLVNLKTQSRAGYGDPSYYYTEMKDYYTA